MLRVKHIDLKKKWAWIKYISFLMLFDCVRVNTGLGFHWICIREKKGRLYAPVGRFWLVNTYPCGCHPSVLSHHALGTAECDESNDGGGPYLVVGVRGILLPWVILRRERRHDHIWISNIFGDVSSGVGLCPYRTYGRGIPIYGDAATPRVFGVHKTDHSLLLTY
jgi:hypothetical protein